ncbi:SAF domain-containing protein [Amycolatopsis sp. NBC_01480]|uniref:SAF domain-containing protein n=1 Tax=Amycolatopsis sp. NBC_01480 TaxID=2903562 RepID=UPI002E299BE8|nr:SAF domain-containing protein [Amycolatopsis sp. NBC_01480]
MTSPHSPIRTEQAPEPAGPVSWLGQKGKPAVLPRGRGGSRRLPHLLVGVLLVVLCVGGAVWWTSTTQDRMPVLAIARPVQVGHVLEPADLRSTDVSFSAGVATVPADRAATMVGRPMATSLAPGALLTPDSVGAAAIPAPGHAVAALGLKPGQFPPELAPGTPVTVVVAAASGSAGAAGQQTGQGSSWQATVVGLALAGTDQTTVISLQLEASASVQLAQVSAGQVALVMLPGGDR